ncbi:ABC transporter ATP-binding protein [Actinocorallia sp. A-T 12471]|uniref:ABC transporter ATP-binding protein n=1 Tax=Actinocorallia sp. A-T 12471 TaxID=3089813 RepID=UPI0029CE75BA|nr:ABC transporter ATP-binding protein [Actinocorallia sp. A-T 12471]MDX6744226.1 ABC transporter ATP-binding protein [Actinocorallia sp. A-T 12471]
MLEVRGVSVRYGQGAPALTALHLRAGPGRVTAVVGGNGAGKSTLMKAVSGVLSFDGGRVEDGAILLDGEPVHRLGPTALVRRGIAHVPEGRRVFADLTVEENLRAGAAVARKALRTRLDESYAMFDVLARRRRQRAVLLSGGEQQMLAIARGLMSGPRLLLLDEPSLGLAPLVVERIAALIARIRDGGTAVLVVEQNAAMAFSVADEGYVLEQGKVVLSGTAAELRADEGVREMYLGGSGTADELRRFADRAPLARWSA